MRIKRSAQARFTRSRLASGGVYIARLVTKAAVSPYLAFSPLRRLRDAVLSVALSLKSPSPTVNRHPACVKLGLSSSYLRTPQPYNLLRRYSNRNAQICQPFSPYALPPFTPSIFKTSDLKAKSFCLYSLKSLTPCSIIPLKISPNFLKLSANK